MVLEHNMISWGKKKKINEWSAAEASKAGIAAVRVAAGGNGGLPRVQAAAFAAGAPLESTVLARLGREVGNGNTPWAFTLPHPDYSLLVVPEPPVLALEIDESLRWAVSSLIDFPVDEAAIAWMKIPTTSYLPTRTPHLYAAISRRSVVEDYDKLFHSARLSLDAVDIQETAQRNIARLIARPDEGIGLLRIGSDGVQFTVTFGGELYLDRFVEESLGGDGLADTAATHGALERIVLQVQRSVDHIERHMPFIDIRRLVLAPLAQALPVEQVIVQNLSLPVERLNLASCFDFTETPELLQEAVQARYFTALGAALRFLD